MPWQLTCSIAGGATREAVRHCLGLRRHRRSGRRLGPIGPGHDCRCPDTGNHGAARHRPDPWPGTSCAAISRAGLGRCSAIMPWRASFERSKSDIGPDRVPSQYRKWPAPCAVDTTWLKRTLRRWSLEILLRHFRRIPRSSAGGGSVCPTYYLSSLLRPATVRARPRGGECAWENAHAM